MFRILSFVLWLLAAALVALALPALLSVRTLKPEQLVEIAILAVLGWSLLELALRTWRVRAEHQSVAKFQDLIAKAQLSAHRPAPYSFRDPRAVRRVNHMAECSKPDIAKLHEAVPAVASLDAAVLAGSYGPLNVYAWVLPVLGFMGTALGMAKAIRGFKDALGRTRGDLDVLVSALADKVVPGLASAFFVTILALGASLVVYLCTSALRDWDQEALNKLDRLCIVMLSRIPLPEAPEGRKIVLALDRISEQLAGVLKTPVLLEEATRALEHAARAMAVSAERLAAASRELEESASAPYTVTSTIERGKRPQAPPRIPRTDGDARPS